MDANRIEDPHWSQMSPVKRVGSLSAHQMYKQIDTCVGQPAWQPWLFPSKLWKVVARPMTAPIPTWKISLTSISTQRDAPASAGR